LARRSWLGKPDEQLRGYLTSNWRIEPHGPIDSLAFETDARQSPADGQLGSALVSRYAAIGSLVHLNLAAQADVLMNFTRPACEPIFSI
jgi:hypothetical protein